MSAGPFSSRNWKQDRIQGVCGICCTFIAPTSYLHPSSLAKQLGSLTSRPPQLHPDALLRRPSWDIAPYFSLANSMMVPPGWPWHQLPSICCSMEHVGRWTHLPHRSVWFGGIGKAGHLLNLLEEGFIDCRTCLVRNKLFSGRLVFFPVSVSHAARSFICH